MLKLRQSLVAFTLLGSNHYVDMLLLQFGMWEYQEDMQHPIVNILKVLLEKTSNCLIVYYLNILNITQDAPTRNFSTKPINLWVTLFIPEWISTKTCSIIRHFL